MSEAKVSQDDEAANTSEGGIDPARLEAVRRKIGSAGMSMTDWANRNGFPIRLVHEILSGRRKCVRGQSHRIAVLLGLKDAELPDLDERLGGTPTPKNRS